MVWVKISMLHMSCDKSGVKVQVSEKIKSTVTLGFTQESYPALLCQSPVSIHRSSLCGLSLSILRYLAFFLAAVIVTIATRVRHLSVNTNMDDNKLFVHMTYTAILSVEDRQVKIHL